MAIKRVLSSCFFSEIYRTYRENRRQRPEYTANSGTIQKHRKQKLHTENRNCIFSPCSSLSLTPSHHCHLPPSHRPLHLLPTTTYIIPSLHINHHQQKQQKKKPGTEQE